MMFVFFCGNPVPHGFSSPLKKKQTVQGSSWHDWLHTIDLGSQEWFLRGVVVFRFSHQKISQSLHVPYLNMMRYRNPMSPYEVRWIDESRRFGKLLLSTFLGELFFSTGHGIRFHMFQKLELRHQEFQGFHCDITRRIYPKKDPKRYTLVPESGLNSGSSKCLRLGNIWWHTIGPIEWTLPISTRLRSHRQWW